MEIPGYTIVDTLGQGGMATVYLAIQQSFEREVALKVMSSALLKTDPNFGERFIRESRIVSRLVHPNIVTVFDVGVCDDHHFLSMEYIPGRDLKEKRFDLSLIERIRVVKEVALALDFAGNKGYVHRDVKPENIMLHEEDGRALLMDFGIAKVADSITGMTQTGTAIGTPHYMSPEQAKGLPVDSRSDIYSLGIVLYLLLTGHVPFDAESAVAVGIKHVSATIPRLPNHIGVFQPIIDKVLAKDPEQRFQRGADLIQALAAITDTRLQAIDDVAAEMQQQQTSDTDPVAETLVSEAVVENNDITEQVAAPTVPVAAVVNSENQAASFAEVLQHTSEPDLESESEPEPELKPRTSSRLFGLLVLTCMGAAGLWFFQPQLQPAWLASRLPPEFSGVKLAAPQPRQINVSDSASDSLASDPATTNVPPVQTPVSESSAAMHKSLQDLRPVVTSIELETDSLNTLENEVEEFDVQEFEAQETVIDSDGTQAELELTRDAEEINQQEQHLARLQAEKLEREQRQRELQQQRDRELEEQIQALLLEGNGYLESGALVQPEQASALYSFTQVLSLQSDNSAAAQGIEAIVARLLQGAERSRQKGRLSQALAQLDQALEIAPQQPKTLRQRARVEADIKRNAQLKSLRLQAEQHVQAGKFIEPSSNNAVLTYREMLKLEAGNPTARRGLNQVQEELARQLGVLIVDGQLENADALLQRSEQHFPDSATLQQQRQSLLAAIDDRTPKISTVAISSNPLESVTAVDPESILNVDRTIYIGFVFDDFQQPTSVIQAVLFDGGRSLKIAQVPVIVSGREGRKFFRIDRPVQGFAAGGYSVDLMLGTDLLASAVFRVN